MDNLIGQTVSHYKIIEKLGEGGMGVVYKAEDTKLRRTVALKFLPADMTRDPEAKERFVQEARAASAMDHSNICTIHEIGETEDGHMFICMACYQGQTLKDKIKDGPLGVEEAVNFAVQAAQGLAKAHGQGIAHRDIKPANIFITEDNEVKIVDFGLAKLAGQMGLTKSGTTVGTVPYMSPEQIRGQGVDHRTDIWSLGTVLYEMITGEMAFKGAYEQAVMYSIMSEEPEPIANFRSDVPQDLEWVIQKAIQKDVSERYQDIDEMLTDLRRLVQGAEVEGVIRPPRVLEKEITKKLLKRIVLPVGIVLFLVIAFVLIRPLLFEQILVSEPKPIAVISFVNETGDSTYNYLQRAIPNLLITSLERLPHLRVTTWERMYDLLKKMGKEGVEIIDKELGFELCRMDGIDAVVLGSFVKAGDMFATDVKVLDVNTKRLLKSASFKGEGVASILKTQIDELTMEISRGVGISDLAFEETGGGIADLTTSSMEAYNYFLRGKEHCEKFYYDDALPFLEKAVELDSTFATAYLYLGWAYDWLHNTEARNEAYEKAHVYSQKATEKERMYIEETYASIIEKDPEKSFQIFTEMAGKYPKEKRVHFFLAGYYKDNRMFSRAIEEFNRALALDPNYGFAINELAYTYADSGDFEKAIEYFERYAAVSPGDANPFDSMGEMYLKMGRLDEAVTKYKEALKIKADFGSDWSISYIYALKENYSEALKWVDQFIAMAPSPGVRVQGNVWKGLYHSWSGNVNRAMSDLDIAANLADVIGNEMWKAHVDRTKGWIYYDRGELERGQRFFQAWYDFFSEFYPPYKPYYSSNLYCYLGLVDVKAGRIETARSRLAEVDSLLPELAPHHRGTIAFRRDALYGEVLLASDSLEKAIVFSESATPLGMLPLMHPWTLLPYNVPFRKDVLARAYQRTGEIDKAISEYERLIAVDPNSLERPLIHPLYHYCLANLYLEKGLSDEAVSQYEQFLDIWKDAEEDLPELIDAKAKLARLKGAS